jgi:hypothetical protein
MLKTKYVFNFRAKMFIFNFTTCESRFGSWYRIILIQLSDTVQ